MSQYPYNYIHSHSYDPVPNGFQYNNNRYQPYGSNDQMFYRNNYSQHPANNNFSTYPNPNFGPSNMHKMHQNNFHNPNNPGNYHNRHNSNFNKRNHNNNKQKNHKNKSPNGLQKNDKNISPKEQKMYEDGDKNKNTNYFCEVCDREFKTNEKYREHCATHRNCSVEGCKFFAAEKLVKIHFENFHVSGVDKKISRLETPEEIEKYRNERKRNFPSAANIENKETIHSEINKQGALLETKQFGRFKYPKKNENKQTNKQENSENLLDEANKASGNKDETSPKELKTSSNAIRNKKNKNKNKKQNKELYTKQKPTLLQQLLADEIRHERNILLQCVRHIVRNNFFETKISMLAPSNVLDVTKDANEVNETKFTEF